MAALRDVIRYFVCGALFLIVLVCQFKFNSLRYQMVDELNRKLPKDSQIPIIGFSLTRLRVLQLYGSYFPESSLPGDAYRLWWVMLAAFLGAVICCMVRF